VVSFGGRVKFKSSDETDDYYVIEKVLHFAKPILPSLTLASIGQSVVE